MKDDTNLYIFRLIFNPIYIMIYLIWFLIVLIVLLFLWIKELIEETKQLNWFIDDLEEENNELEHKVFLLENPDVKVEDFSFFRTYSYMWYILWTSNTPVYSLNFTLDLVKERIDKEVGMTIIDDTKSKPKKNVKKKAEKTAK